MTAWHYADAASREPMGPVDDEGLARLFHQGALRLDALVWRDGMAEWQPLRTFARELGLDRPPAEQSWGAAPAAAVRADPFAPVAAPPGTPAAVAPSPTGNPFLTAADHVLPGDPGASTGPGDAIDYVPPAAHPAAGGAPRSASEIASAPLPAGWAMEDARPAMPPPPAYGAPTDSAADSLYAPSRAAVGAVRARSGAGGGGPMGSGYIVYAGFWKRAAALFIDSVILGIIAYVLESIFFGRHSLGAAGLLTRTQGLQGALNIVYYSAFHACSLQATPGKLAVGIKVARSDGAQIGFGRSVCRTLATILSTLILCIGYLMAAFTDRKRALHDLICDTVVVDRYAFTDQDDWQRPELGVVTIVVIVLGGGAAVLFVIGIAVLVATFAGH